MNLSEYKILKLIFIQILTIIILSGCGNAKMDIEKSEPTFPKLAELIKEEDLGGLNLTIHYLDPGIAFNIPLTFERFLVSKNPYKIIRNISSDELKEYLDLLEQLSYVDLVPIEQESDGYGYGIRLYYYFETENDGKILEVAMWGEEYSIFVNENLAERSNIFFDMVIPFLPEDAVEILQQSRDREINEIS